MSEYKIKPNDSAVGKQGDCFTAYAIGFGVAVCLYDGTKKTGGFCYALFPKTSGHGSQKSVREVLDTLLEQLEQAGSCRENLWAKILGGATIFRFSDQQKNNDTGRQNVEQCRSWLEAQGIPVKAEDTGGNFARTVRFLPADGSVEISLVNQCRYYL